MQKRWWWFNMIYGPLNSPLALCNPPPLQPGGGGGVTWPSFWEGGLQFSLTRGHLCCVYLSVYVCVCVFTCACVCDGASGYSRSRPQWEQEDCPHPSLPPTTERRLMTPGMSYVWCYIGRDLGIQSVALSFGPSACLLLFAMVCVCVCVCVSECMDHEPSMNPSWCVQRGGGGLALPHVRCGQARGHQLASTTRQPSLKAPVGKKCSPNAATQNTTRPRRTIAPGEGSGDATRAVLKACGNPNAHHEHKSKYSCGLAGAQAIVELTGSLCTLAHKCPSPARLADPKTPSPLPCLRRSPLAPSPPPPLATFEDFHAWRGAVNP